MTIITFSSLYAFCSVVYFHFNVIHFSLNLHALLHHFGIVERSVNDYQIGLFFLNSQDDVGGMLTILGEIDLYDFTIITFCVDQWFPFWAFQ